MRVNIVFGHMSVNLVQIGVTLHSELEGCHSINRTKLQLDLKEKVFDVEKCVRALKFFYIISATSLDLAEFFYRRQVRVRVRVRLDLNFGIPNFLIT